MIKKGVVEVTLRLLWLISITFELRDKMTDIRVRLSKKQKEELKILTRVNGFITISNFVRHRLFDNNSVHLKLNEIIKKLDEVREK
jgi:predicted nuclease with TOPRIM domain|tara:strand:- start:2102 stop:2359 length:258 start_codon:yes stop_codon:yes gene_type:complete